MTDLAYAYAIAALVTFAACASQRHQLAWWMPIVGGLLWPGTWAFVVFNCIYERMNRGRR